MANMNRTVVITDMAELRRQVEEAVTALTHALETLVSQLEAAASSEEECPEFADLIAASQRLLALDDADMSKALKVSRPTISRWTRGKTSPHPVVRNAMVTVLIKRAQSKIKSLRI